MGQLCVIIKCLIHLTVKEDLFWLRVLEVSVNGWLALLLLGESTWWRK